MEVLKSLISDLDDVSIPRDFEKAFDKIKCDLTAGKRIFWYHKEHKDYCLDNNIPPKDLDCYSGIVVPRPNMEHNGGELETDECVVVMDRYPCEKSYPETDWIALNRILDDEELVEIYSD